MDRVELKLKLQIVLLQLENTKLKSKLLELQFGALEGQAKALRAELAADVPAPMVNESPEVA